MKYDREQYLAQRIDDFFCNSMKLPQGDYCRNLTIEQFTSMKTAVSDINNIITLRLSLRFAKWLKELPGVAQKTIKLIHSEIKKTKPNTNGYDIEYTSILFKLIAEVKCNIPINEGKKFGSNQKNGIKKDINGLLHGKRTSKVAPKDYLKFFVLYDTPPTRLAMKSFYKSLPEEIKSQVELEAKVFNDKQKVYVIFLK